MNYLKVLKKNTPTVLAAEGDLAKYSMDRTDPASVRLRNQLVMRHAKLLVGFYAQDRVKRARFDNTIGMERAITRMVHGLLDMRAPPRIQEEDFTPHVKSHEGAEGAPKSARSVNQNADTKVRKAYRRKKRRKKCAAKLAGLEERARQVDLGAVTETERDKKQRLRRTNIIRTSLLPVAYVIVIGNAKVGNMSWVHSQVRMSGRVANVV